MIRVALIVMGFLAITLTLIAMQPSAPGFTAPSPDTYTDQGVTRADTDFDTLIDAPAPATAAKPDPQPEPPAANAALRTAEAAKPADPAPAPDAVPAPAALEGMILAALKQGQNDTYIDALVNDAAEKGRVEVPGTLITSDGRVDTATLLKVLSAAPDALRAGGTLYTVEAGDSLASIAYRFYGTTRRADDIHEANLGTFAQTGLAAGQELVIPPK